ncbi:MAG TPA: hypothetical protein IAC30_05115 [Candidatus Faecousia intestinavium]|nr:hypothetical protein [Candidatus Faecousia intestinavium]
MSISFSLVRGFSRLKSGADLFFRFFSKKEQTMDVPFLFGLSAFLFLSCHSFFTESVFAGFHSHAWLFHSGKRYVCGKKSRFPPESVLAFRKTTKGEHLV